MKYKMAMAIMFILIGIGIIGTLIQMAEDVPSNYDIKRQMCYNHTDTDKEYDRCMSDYYFNARYDCSIKTQNEQQFNKCLEERDIRPFNISEVII